MNLDIETGLELIKTAFQKDTENRLWQQWLVDYSNMDKETFMTFEKYKAKAFKNTTEINQKVDIKQVLIDVEAIKKEDQKGGR